METNLKILQCIQKLWPEQCIMARTRYFGPQTLTSKCDLDLWGTGLNIKCDTSSHNGGKPLNAYESYGLDKKIRTDGRTNTQTLNIHCGNYVKLTEAGLTKYSTLHTYKWLHNMICLRIWDQGIFALSCTGVFLYSIHTQNTSNQLVKNMKLLILSSFSFYI